MITELINHLWQSTLFAVAAGFLTAAFRKNRAEVRYWLWFSASLKFLVPFALLMALGSHVRWTPAAEKIATRIAAPAVWRQISQPFPGTLPQSPSTQSARDWALRQRWTEEERVVAVRVDGRQRADDVADVGLVAAQPAAQRVRVDTDPGALVGRRTTEGGSRTRLFRLPSCAFRLGSNRFRHATAVPGVWPASCPATVGCVALTALDAATANASRAQL